ncbi:hypothetical protein HPB50_017073 [Hyalomma asiaticum]|uniref:Uncharacterized protein n=1 Tax=Hyalomma asiaticum TaxID=266040 RepID=A0ACB7SQW5_HYAAI|nr:hypothetical protein HPB50_017073 [Hyalomma asiaticum]
MCITPQGAVQDPPLLLQGKKFGWADRYRYLGVTIVTERNYVREYEEKLCTKALSRAFLGSRTLRPLGWYEVTRDLWKSVVVPSLTFGNAILCLLSMTWQALEVYQREAG